MTGTLRGLLRRRGFDLETRNEHGETLLHVSCRLGAAWAVPILLGHGANVYARTDKGSYPLHLAAAVYRSRCGLAADSGAVGSNLGRSPGDANRFDEFLNGRRRWGCEPRNRD